MGVSARTDSLRHDTNAHAHVMDMGTPRASERPDREDGGKVNTL